MMDCVEEESWGVSVVVPVYNADATLEECVGSVLELDYPAGRWELICVDNGSKDRSLAILESFGPGIRVLREAKRGPAATRNCGIRNARFSIIAFTDSDCKVDPQWLRHLVEPLSDPGVGISGGTIRAWNPTNKVETFGEVVHDNAKAITYYKPPYNDTASWASRRDVLLKLGCFDETFLRQEDCELSCRVLQAGLKIAYAPEAVVYHRNERNFAGLFREGFQHGMHAIPLFERHRIFYQNIGYRPRRLAPYRQLWDHFREYMSGTNPETADCNLVFNAGKRLGRLAGSIRFGSLHL